MALWTPLKVDTASRNNLSVTKPRLLNIWIKQDYSSAQVAFLGTGELKCSPRKLTPHAEAARPKFRQNKAMLKFT